MNLAALPISAVAAALGVVCLGVLYTLHHLRVQPRQAPTATLLFWRQAVRPQQTRVPWSRRFTHRKTFLLSAATLILLALTLTADRWGRGTNTQRDVIVVDAGTATSADDGKGHSLLRTITAAAGADLHQLPDGVALIAAGPRPQLLARSGEPAALAARQLDELRPQNGASASSLAIQMAGGVIGDHAGQIHWYTAENQTPGGLPVEVAKRIVLHQVRAPDCVAIVGVTFEPSIDDEGHGTLRVRLAGAAKADVTISAKSGEQAAQTQSVALSGDTADVAFPNLPSDGQTVRVELRDAPGAVAMHTGEFRMPDRRALTFRFVGDVPRALVTALLTTGSRSDDGSVAVMTEGMTPPPGVKAAIIVVGAGKGVAAGSALNLAEASAVRGLDLENATAVDGPALPGDLLQQLTAGGATVAGVTRGTGLPTLYLSSSIVGPAAELPKHAAFPVLVGRLCDALLGRGNGSIAVAIARTAQDPLWTGPADAPATHAVTVADRPPSGQTVAALPLERALSPMPWTAIVLLGALTLVSVDAALRVARKIV